MLGHISFKYFTSVYSGAQLLHCDQVIGVVNITTLTNRQYCVVLDPVDAKGNPQFGRKKLVKGEKSFFLMPGERLEKGIQNIYILGEDEGLILKAVEGFVDSVRWRRVVKVLVFCIHYFVMLSSFRSRISCVHVTWLLSYCKQEALTCVCVWVTLSLCLFVHTSCNFFSLCLEK